MAPGRPNAKTEINRDAGGPTSPEAADVIHRAARLARAIPYGEVNRFTQLALVSAGVTLGLPVPLHEWLGLEERVAVALALATAFAVNFIVARSYVFRASGAFGPQLLRFALASAGFRVAEYLAFLLLFSVLGVFYVLALGLVLVISFGVKFAFYRTYVFTSTESGAEQMAAPQPATLIRTWHQSLHSAAKRIATRDVVFFGALFAYYLFYPHPGFEGLIPDNIAQTAYWSLLTRPDLAGSIGSSSPKGGLIILLGGAHYLSYEVLQSAWPFKAMLALFFASTLYLIGRIAAQIGGPVAALLAVLVAAGSLYLPLTFYSGSSNLFFLPPVLLGLMLLSMGRDRAAILVLCLAVTVRPEALTIIGLVIAIRYLRRGDWRRSIEFAGYGAAALLFFLLLAYWTQGSWDRIGAGAATGYPAFASLRTVEHMRVILGQFFSERFVTLLLLPALFTLVRVEYTRTYLYFYSMVLVFIVLVLIDFFGMHYRYIAPGQVIVFALGCGGLMRMYDDLRQSDLHMPAVSTLVMAVTIVALSLTLVFWSTRSITACLMMLAIPAAYLLAAAARHRSGSDRLLPACHVAIALFMALAPIASAVKARQEFSASVGTHHPAISDALEFLGDARVPSGSAVIAEDELLNYLLVKRPDYFTWARSIQAFNVMTDAQRSEALSKAQFLYVSKRRNHGWNYLFYYPKATWVTDPFRAVVVDMIRTNEPRSVLGSILQPIYNSDTRFIATIHPDPGGGAETRKPGTE